MPAFKNESGFLQRIFTTCAANSGFLSLTAKSIYGVFLLSSLSSDPIEIGKKIFEVLRPENGNGGRGEK